MSNVQIANCEFANHMDDGPIDSGQKRVGGWITLTAADVFLRPASITPGVRWPR